LSSKDEHNDFDDNIRDRFNSEQNVPPSHLWDDINRDASNFDDSSFDDAIRKKFNNHQTSAPVELWPKINNRASSLVKRPFSFLKWTTIPALILLLYFSVDYLTSNEDLHKKEITNNKSNNISDNNSEETAQNKEIVDKKAIEDSIKSSNVKSVQKVNNNSIRKIDKQSEQKSNHNSNKTTNNFKNEMLTDIEKENLKALRAYLEREQYGKLDSLKSDSLSHYYRNIEESEIEKLNISNMKYFDFDNKLKDSITGKDVISANENISQNKKIHISKEDNQAVNEQTDKLDSNTTTVIAEVSNKIDSTLLDSNSISKETSELAIQEENKSDSIKKADGMSISITPPKRFHFSLFFSPTYASSIIRKGNIDEWKDDNGELLMTSQDNLEQNTSIKNFYRRKQQGYMSYNFGVNLGYDITNKIAINFGVNYFEVEEKFVEQDAFYYDLPIRLDQYNDNSISTYSIMGSSNINVSNIDFYPDSIAISMQDVSDSNYYKYDYFEIQNTKYLNFPINLSYRIQKNRWSLILEGGIFASIVYNSTSEINLYQRETEEQWEIRGFEHLRRFSFGANIGLGVEYALNDRISLLCMPNFSYSLSNINSENKFKVNPYAFRFSTGIRLRF